MEKYIYQLLTNNKRIIIPGIGALVIKNDDSKAIYFNEYLKFNDGLLINYVGEKEKLDIGASTQKVTDFANNLIKTLDSGKSIKIEEAGTLIKDDTGKIVFCNEMPGSTNEAATQKITKTKEDKVKATEPENEPTVITEKIKDVQKTPEILNKSEFVIKDKSTTKTPTKMETKLNQQASSKGPQSSRPETYTKPGQPKSNKSLAIVAIILIPLVALGIWIYAFNGSKTLGNMKHKIQYVFMSKIHQLKGKNISVSKNLVINNDSTKKNQETVSTTTNQLNEINSPNSKNSNKTTGKKYYIVGGCFKIEQNANNYVEKLKGGGYDAENFGKFGIFFAVSYKALDTKEDALVELKKIRNSIEPNAWVLYY